MKKKLLAILLVAVAAFTCAFAFAACEDKPKNEGGTNNGQTAGGGTIDGENTDNKDSEDNEEPTVNYVGTYYFFSLTHIVDGTVKEIIKVGEPYNNSTAIVEEDYIIFEVRADGTFVQAMYGTTGTAPWKLEDDKLIVYAENNDFPDIECVLKGDTLTCIQRWGTSIDEFIMIKK